MTKSFTILLLSLSTLIGANTARASTTFARTNQTAKPPSGGKVGSAFGGGTGNYSATQTATSLNGVTMSSDFLSFVGVTGETGSWALSGLTPNFAADATLAQNFCPTDGTSFLGANVATFSGEAPPSGVPEPATLSLIGGALLGLGLVHRKRRSP